MRYKNIDSDLKANGWGVPSITEIQDGHHLLTIFQIFYYLSGRLPFTNGLIIVPDGEVPEGMEKINLKNLYSMFRDTKSHGLVSLRFPFSFGKFSDPWTSIPKYALKNYIKMYPMKLNGTRNHEFESALWQVFYRSSRRHKFIFFKTRR